MSQVNWTTPLATLDAALATLGTGNPLRAIGDDIRLRLNTIGLVYDALWSTDINTAKAAGDAALTAAVTAFDTATTTAFTQADTAAAMVEALQVTAQASTPGQYVGLSAGKKYVLAPNIATPYDTSELAASSAGITLVASAVPILRLTAKEPGVQGNTVQSRVVVVPGTTVILDTTNTGHALGTFDVPKPRGIVSYDVVNAFATDVLNEIRFTTETTITLEVKRDGYVEYYPLVKVNDKIDVKQSLLLASAEWFPGVDVLPDALSWTALSGGAGGGLSTVKTRLSRASGLSACSAANKTVLDQLSPLLEKQATGFPGYPVTPASYPYARKPMATRFVNADGTSYVVPRVVTDLPTGTNFLRLSVLEVEIEVSDLINDASDFEAVLPP